MQNEVVVYIRKKSARLVKLQLKQKLEDYFDGQCWDNSI